MACLMVISKEYYLELPRVKMTVFGLDLYLAEDLVGLTDLSSASRSAGPTEMHWVHLMEIYLDERTADRREMMLVRLLVVLFSDCNA